MKKLIISLILLFAAPFLFAESWYNYKSENEYFQMDDKCEISYRLKSTINPSINLYKLSFIKRSYVSKIMISIDLSFENEELLKQYSLIDLENIETEFQNLISKFRDAGISPDNFLDSSNVIIYRGYITKNTVSK